MLAVRWFRPKPHFPDAKPKPGVEEHKVEAEQVIYGADLRSDLLCLWRGAERRL